MSCSQRLAFLSDDAEAENLLESATLRIGGPSAHQGNKGCAMPLAWHIAGVAGNILPSNQSGFITDIYYYSAVLLMLSDPYICCVRFQCSLSCRLEHPTWPSRTGILRLKMRLSRTSRAGYGTVDPAGAVYVPQTCNKEKPGILGGNCLEPSHNDDGSCCN